MTIQTNPLADSAARERAARLAAIRASIMVGRATAQIATHETRACCALIEARILGSQVSL